MNVESTSNTPSAAYRGRTLTVNDLPPANTRWVIRRKGELVACIYAGVISVQEACARYALSEEELESWMKSIRKFGEPGLRVTRIQNYRGRSARA